MAQGTSQHPSVPVSANALAKASVESFIASPLVCCLSNKPRKEFKFRIDPKSIGSFTVTRNRKRRDRVALRASGRRAGGDWKPTRSSSDARETGSYRRLAALVHLAKGLARQYARKKIRVNVVSPGTVYFKGGVWNTIEQNMPNDTKRHSRAIQPAAWQRRRRLRTRQCSLASPASSFTTGSNLVVDGAVSNRVNF